jgi:membrane-bound ClpP family serine protease
MPRAFQIEAGIRGAGATLMTLALLLFLVNPLWAGMAYVSLGVLLFIADWELSKYFIRHHSWRLALASVFFRQIEYSTVICGVITGFFRKK